MTGRVFLAVFLTYLATHGGHLYTTDEETHFRTAESILVRRTFAVEEATDRPLNLAPGADGRTYAYYPPGLALLLLPFAAVGRAVGIVLDETTYIPRATASLLGPLAGAAIVSTAVSTWLRRGIPHGTAVVGAALLALANYLWPATKVAGSQPAVAAGLVLLAACLDGGRSRAGSAGLAAGALLCIRYEALLFATLLATPFLGRRPGAWGRFLLGLLPGIAVAGISNHVRFGAPWVTGYPEVAGGVAAGFSTPWTTGLHGLLLSPGRGVVWYAPVALLLVEPLVRRARAGDPLARGALLAAGASLLLYARVISWHTPSWGPRHLVPAVALVSLGAGAWAEAWRARSTAYRAAAIVVVVVGAVANLLGALVSYDAHVDRMVERGRAVEDWVFDWTAHPFLGQWETLRSVSWGRVEVSGERLLPAGGGHPWTQELRRSIDVWAVYAYKVGVPAPISLGLWAANVAAAAWAWRRLLVSVRTA